MPSTKPYAPLCGSYASASLLLYISQAFLADNRAATTFAIRADPRIYNTRGFLRDARRSASGDTRGRRHDSRHAFFARLCDSVRDDARCFVENGPYTFRMTSLRPPQLQRRRGQRNARIGVRTRPAILMRGLASTKRSFVVGRTGHLFWNLFRIWNRSQIYIACGSPLPRL